VGQLGTRIGAWLIDPEAHSEEPDHTDAVCILYNIQDDAEGFTPPHVTGTFNSMTIRGSNAGSNGRGAVSAPGWNQLCHTPRR